MPMTAHKGMKISVPRSGRMTPMAESHAETNPQENRKKKKKKKKKRGFCYGGVSEWMNEGRDVLEEMGTLIYIINEREKMG